MQYEADADNEHDFSSEDEIQFEEESEIPDPKQNGKTRDRNRYTQHHDSENPPHSTPKPSANQYDRGDTVDGVYRRRNSQENGLEFDKDVYDRAHYLSEGYQYEPTDDEDFNDEQGPIPEVQSRVPNRSVRSELRPNTNVGPYVQIRKSNSNLRDTRRVISDDGSRPNAKHERHVGFRNDVDHFPTEPMSGYNEVRPGLPYRMRNENDRARFDPNRAAESRPYAEFGQNEKNYRESSPENLSRPSKHRQYRENSPDGFGRQRPSKPRQYRDSSPDDFSRHRQSRRRDYYRESSPDDAMSRRSKHTNRTYENSDVSPDNFYRHRQSKRAKSRQDRYVRRMSESAESSSDEFDRNAKYVQHKHTKRRHENDRHDHLSNHSRRSVRSSHDSKYRYPQTDSEDELNDNPRRARYERERPEYRRSSRYTHDRRDDENWGRRSYRKERNPEKFDGDKIEWPDYYKHFETVANWNRWGDQEKAMQLVMSLQGEALRVLGDLSLETQNDYDTLIDELTRRFNPAERESAWKLEFRNRIRTEKETAMQYGYALKRLAMKAFPSMTLSAQEQWIMDQFITGLGSIDLRKHVQFGHPKTLSQAISLAVEYEAFDPNSKSKKPTVKPGEFFRIDGANGNGHQGNQANRQQNDYGQKSKWDKSTVRCFRCNEFGHYKSECPKSRNETNSRFQNSDQIVNQPSVRGGNPSQGSTGDKTQNQGN
jgi:hypothetical protein